MPEGPRPHVLLQILSFEVTEVSRVALDRGQQGYASHRWLCFTSLEDKQHSPLSSSVWCAWVDHQCCFYEDTVFLNGSVGRSVQYCLWFSSASWTKAPAVPGRGQGKLNTGLHFMGRGETRRSSGLLPRCPARSSLLWALTLTSIPCQKNHSISLVIPSLLSFWGLAHCSTSAQRKLIFSILMQRFFFST